MKGRGVPGWHCAGKNGLGRERGAGKNCYICDIPLPADGLQEAYGAFAKDADMTKTAKKIKFD